MKVKIIIIIIKIKIIIIISHHITYHIKDKVDYQG